MDRWTQGKEWSKKKWMLWKRRELNSCGRGETKGGPWR
jgi:hypothetical protein